MIDFIIFKTVQCYITEYFYFILNRNDTRRFDSIRYRI